MEVRENLDRGIDYIGIRVWGFSEPRVEECEEGREGGGGRRLEKGEEELCLGFCHVEGGLGID